MDDSSRPRWLSREALAEYISVRVDQLRRLQKEGKLPAPSLAFGPRQPRWWSPDVDASLGTTATNTRNGRQTLAEAILAAEAKKSRARRQEAPG